MTAIQNETKQSILSMLNRGDLSVFDKYSKWDIWFATWHYDTTKLPDAVRIALLQNDDFCKESM